LNINKRRYQTAYPSGAPVYRRRTDTTKEKGQTTIYKNIHIKLKIK